MRKGAVGPIVRTRDGLTSNPKSWATSEGTEFHAERFFYTSDFRGNVSAIVSSGGNLIEQYRYSATGVPFGIPRGDVNADGLVGTPSGGGGGGGVAVAAFTASSNADYDQTEYLMMNNTYEVRADWNLDGVIDPADAAVVAGMNGVSTGRKAMSAAGVGNRIAMKAEYTLFDAYFDATKNQSKWTLTVHLGGIVIGQLLPVDPNPGRDSFRLPVDPRDRCAQVLNDAQDDPDVAALLLELRRECGPDLASQIRLYSTDCGEGDGRGRDAGGFKCRYSPIFGNSYEIRVCRNLDGSCPELLDVVNILLHEIRHAIQMCQAGGCKKWTKEQSCASSVRREIEAYCEERDRTRVCCGAFGLRPRRGLTRCMQADVLCEFVKESSARHCGGGSAGAAKAKKECMDQMGCTPPIKPAPPAPPSLIPKCRRLP